MELETEVILLSLGCPTPCPQMAARACEVMFQVS